MELENLSFDILPSIASYTICHTLKLTSRFDVFELSSDQLKKNNCQIVPKNQYSDQTYLKLNDPISTWD